MTRIITNVKEYEVWKSSIPGKIFLKRFDRKGDLKDELVPGGRTVHVLPEERHINQEMAADAGLDPFLNGMLVPVKLIEGTEDTAEIQSNPNLLGEDDMKKMFENRRARKQFEESVSSIDNPVTLTRLLAVATEVDATLTQVEAVKSRLQTVSGEAIITEVETVADGRLVR